MQSTSNKNQRHVPRQIIQFNCYVPTAIKILRYNQTHLYSFFRVNIFIWLLDFTPLLFLFSINRRRNRSHFIYFLWQADREMSRIVNLLFLNFSMTWSRYARIPLVSFGDKFCGKMLWKEDTKLDIDWFLDAFRLRTLVIQETIV